MEIDETERSLVLAELERRQDRLVEGMVEAIADEIPLYRAHPDPGLMDDLHAHVRDNIAMFLLVAREHRVPRPDELGFVAEMVQHRVVQGVPMDQVLHAFRIGQRVLWERIVIEAGELGAGPEAALSLALPAMQYADAASSEFTACYVRLEEEVRASTDRASAEVVDALGHGRWPADRALAALGRPFPVAVAQPYLAVEVLGAPGPRLGELRRQLVLACATGSLRGAVARVTGDELAAFAAVAPEATTEAPAELAATVRRLCDRLAPQASVGIGAIADGVAEVPESHREAAAAARQAQGGATVIVAHLGVVERAALATGAIADPARLVPRSVRQFVAEDLARDGTLIATAVAHVECDLNTRRTAERLFVHRNTIRYRLGRIAELAGVDVRRPSQMFELVAAIRLLRAQHGAPAAERPGR